MAAGLPSRISSAKPAMGIDHRRLSFPHQGLNQRLTGVEERRVVTKALA